jgi:hypothetical protein
LRSCSRWLVGESPRGEVKGAVRSGLALALASACWPLYKRRREAFCCRLAHVVTCSLRRGRREQTLDPVLGGTRPCRGDSSLCLRGRPAVWTVEPRAERQKMRRKRREPSATCPLSHARRPVAVGSRGVACVLASRPTADGDRAHGSRPRHGDRSNESWPRRMVNLLGCYCYYY